MDLCLGSASGIQSDSDSMPDLLSSSESESEDGNTRKTYVKKKHPAPKPDGNPPILFGGGLLRSDDDDDSDCTYIPSSSDDEYTTDCTSAVDADAEDECLSEPDTNNTYL